ncbi:MAG: sulfatase family protein [Planctomycetota bacterium]|jgi:arylsulfatase A-like enzyme
MIVLKRGLVCVVALCGLAFHAVSQERPNILIIVADDLGWADVGYHGSPIPTPNIDRLCRTGVELDRHYVAPMCTPTRIGLLTGRYWSRFGVTSASNERSLPWETVTLASALRSVGYDTAITGKWHLGSTPEWGPRRFGFNRTHGSLAGGVNPWSHLYKHGPYMKTWHRNDTLIEEEGHATDLITREAVRYIEAPREGPFFVYVPYTAVHTPFDEPDRYLKMCEHIDEDRRQYAACMAHLDEGVGKMVAALERTGQRDNTLVLFFSDNGGTNGDDSKSYPNTKPTAKIKGLNHPLRGWKTQVYEGGVRTPAFVNWPGRLRPGKVIEPLHVTDWMPTLCKLVGYEPEADLRWDGADIWAVITGGRTGSAITNRVLYTKGVRGNAFAVIHSGWKLVLLDRGEKAELFDLKNDPNETADLAAKEPERVAALRNLLTEVAALDDSVKADKARPDPKR